MDRNKYLFSYVAQNEAIRTVHSTYFTSTTIKCLVFTENYNDVVYSNIFRHSCNLNKITNWKKNDGFVNWELPIYIIWESVWDIYCHSIKHIYVSHPVLALSKTCTLFI